jgi:hypothetical protein
MIEQLLRQLDFDFAHLPPFVVGESKEIRLLTPRVVVAKLLPTVYSFTKIRYGRWRLAKGRESPWRWSNKVEIAAAGRSDGFRVSPRGMMELRGEARRVLEEGANRHFWFELDDEGKKVTLCPYV